jgi:CDP-glucose 4,6-dehydratase
MDSYVYRGKKVFISGHTGFKGSWLCETLLDLRAEICGYALPAGRPSHFDLLGLAERMHAYEGDIRNLPRLKEILTSFAPEIVFHFAAQSLVPEGYANPAETYAVNVMGTVNLLEAVRFAPSVKSVVIVTTDKVYRESKKGAYTEDDALDGYDPYSNSKSCAELVAATYYRCYLKSKGVAVSVCRAGNAIGGGDFSPGRLVPDCVASAYSEKALLLRNPSFVRPYQFVLEPIRAYIDIAIKQITDPSLSSAYNIGPAPEDSLSNLELIELIGKIVPGIRVLRVSDSSRPHESERLTLDSSKIKRAIGWEPKLTSGEAIKLTAEWYRAYYEGSRAADITKQQIKTYFNL